MSYDKDLKIMAASDLTNLITPLTPVCPHTLQILLKHLDEESVDIQGNAVKCIS
jgi:hypothetical protein